MLVQKTKECKMNRILENEIEKLISRTPTEEELNSAIEYLDGCADDLTKAEHIPELLKDWLHDCMTKCQWCGAWGLMSEMEEEYGYFYCDKECLVEANDGLDMDAEARAEYVALNR